MQNNQFRIGSFCLLKNESHWIAAHLEGWLPYLDEIVLFDGNSTDGTLEIIEAVRREHPEGHKITLVRDRDPKDLQDDYVRLFDECMKTLRTDIAAFLHPDMYPSRIPELSVKGCVAASMRMRSFAGNPGEGLFEIKGRGEAWKNIYRLRNPDLGAHYFGHYGHADEDVYFSAITGNRHEHYGQNFNYYPYIVQDSGWEVLHFSDVRSPRRRFERMVSCLLNNAHSGERAKERALSHPRVTLKDGDGFSFIPANYPDSFVRSREKYRHLEKELISA